MKPALYKPVAMLLAALVLTGCGTRFLYDRMDTVAYLYIATQVSLSDEQELQLRSQLRDFLDWHRAFELPRYAGFMDSLAREAVQPMGRQRIDAAGHAIEALWLDSARRGAPPAANWLAGLQPAQLDELFASLAEDDADLREEYCDIELQESLVKREKMFISALKDWIGRPTPTQRVLIGERLALMQSNDCAWIESRGRFRIALREEVDRAATDPHYEATMVRLLTRPEELWDPAYRARFDANRGIFVDLVADLDATLDQRQRHNLTSKLQDYARDFSSIAQSAESAEGS